MRDLYLVWALGLSTGFYLGSRHPLNSDSSILFYTLILTCILLLLFGFLMVRKAQSSEGKKSNNNKNPSLHLHLILLLVPTLSFLILGYLVCEIKIYKETRNILSQIYNLDERGSVALEGRILTHPRFKNGNLYFSLEVNRLSFYNANQNLERSIELCDTVEVRVKNTYPGFLERDEYIKASGEIDKSHFISEPGEVTKVKVTDFETKIFGLRKKVYQYLKSIYYQNLDFVSASISEALFLGNITNIPDSVQDNFRKSGVFHVLAISGLHVSLLVYFLGIFRKANFSWVTVWVIILFLILYNFLVGEKASAQRATIMSIFAIFGKRLGREYSMRMILYIAYIFMILSNPSFWQDLGFWLSFGSMAAIIFISPLLKQLLEVWLPKSKAKMVQSYWVNLVISSISVQIFLFPLLLYFFGEVSMVFIFSNLMIMPFFYVVLFLLFVASALGLVYYFLGALFVKLSYFFTRYMLKVVEFWGEKKVSIFSVDYFQVKYIILYYIGLVVCLVVLTRLINRDKIKKEWLEKLKGLKN